jgi:two-component system OmpR family response regulator
VPDRPEARVLVVDDERTIAELLTTALRFVGFEVRTAATGREALAAAADFHPELVLLDVMLPDLDGFEVCRRLRADGDRVPVIFLTARDAPEEKVRGLTIGGDDYVTKPFSLEEVVARVRTVLRRSRSEISPQPLRAILVPPGLFTQRYCEFPMLATPQNCRQSVFCRFSGFEGVLHVVDMLDALAVQCDQDVADL